VRQFFTMRFWLTLAALGGLALAVVVLAKSQESESAAGQIGAGGSDDSGDVRRIDLVTWVFAVMPSQGFQLVDGVTTTDMAVVVDGTRTMMVKAGTHGEINCPGLTEAARCTIAVDLLGDAVLWFSIFPGPPSTTVLLPSVSKILDGGWVQLSNGWEVRHAETVDRLCDDDTSSLTEFIERYGTGATTTYDVELQRVVRVTCPRATTTTTSSTVPLVPTTLFDPFATTLPPPETAEPG
jgi:hypothetical protein